MSQPGAAVVVVGGARRGWYLRLSSSPRGHDAGAAVTRVSRCVRNPLCDCGMQIVLHVLRLRTLHMQCTSGCRAQTPEQFLAATQRTYNRFHCRCLLTALCKARGAGVGGIAAVEKLCDGLSDCRRSRSAGREREMLGQALCSRSHWSQRPLQVALQAITYLSRLAFGRTVG